MYTITVQNGSKFLLPEAAERGVGVILTTGVLAVLAGVMIGTKKR